MQSSPFPTTRLITLTAAAFLAATTAGLAASSNGTRPAAAGTTPIEPGRVIIEPRDEPPPPPLFFSATAVQTVALDPEEIRSEIRLELRIIQGRPEVLSLGLMGDGEIVAASGAGLAEWAVRRGTGDAGEHRWLDLRPTLVEDEPPPETLEVVVHTRRKEPAVPGSHTLLLLAPGEAVGFASTVTLQPHAAIDIRVTAADGMVPLHQETKRERRDTLQFQSTGAGKITLRLDRRGAGRPEAEVVSARLLGTVNESAGSVAFRLHGRLRGEKAGARLRILSGRAALSETTGGEGWHVELVRLGDAFAYELVMDRNGTFPLELAFAANLRENGDWQAVDFQIPAGAVVPVLLAGLDEAVEFDPAATVVPHATPQGWQGFLPADGTASMAWKKTRASGDGTLFFTSSEQTDVEVGAGVLRQLSRVSFRVLQGRLAGVRFQLEGPGEILGVLGDNIVGWQVVSDGDSRALDVQLSRPIEGEGLLLVQSQSALESFPVRAEALRLTPEGTVRHSGFVRISNSGAVRLEVAEAEGMLQLAPAQYPGPALDGNARQVFVYRFPSHRYTYRILAGQIQPEVGVSQIVTYELADSDRVISADLELDIREAPLRDWSLRIPDDYAVVSVAGKGVADYVVESEAADGRRTLKVAFVEAVQGRQLLRLRLEQNAAAAAGEWALPVLRFPGAKSVRGHVGAVAAPGFRIVPGPNDGLVEVPLSYFPKQTTGLQQAWRLRAAGWSATVQVEALGQSVQADVFHLYSLKEGVVYGSVLLNYFVVGAPASEWRIEVPASVGNIDIVGQNVRRDWRREGDEVVVSLHQPVLGAATILVTFEQPMSARGGTIQPGEIRPLGVQAERGYVQVVSPLQVKHEILAAEGGLLTLEPLELPLEFRLLTTSPSLAVYQYTARPFTLEMGVEWYEPGEMVDQVVDFARLSSQVSRDGQVVTNARYFVKTRGRKALRLVLPDNMKLWEARIDHEIVNARAHGNQTLLPLPARLNPNEPVEVVLRLGQSNNGSTNNLTLTAPRMLVPTVINEWTLHGDPERLLVPRGGNAELTRPTLTETGFEWISLRGRRAVPVLLALMAATAWLFRAQSAQKPLWGKVRNAKVVSGSWRFWTGLLLGACTLFMAGMLTLTALVERRANLDVLTYASTVIPTGEAVTVQVANVETWRALISWWGIAGIIAGFALLVVRFVRSWRGRVDLRLLTAACVVLLAVGMLAQRGGAALFFAGTGATVLLLLMAPAVIHWSRQRGDRKTKDPTGPDAGATSVVSLFVVAGGATALVLTSPTPAQAAEAKSWPAGEVQTLQTMNQSWSIRDERVFAEIEFTVRGQPGDSFLLLRSPAVLTDFRGDGLRLAKVERAGRTDYHVVPEQAGTFTAQARFEMPAPDLNQDLPLPTGAAAVQRVTIDLDEGGWEFTSPMAMEVLAVADAGADRSGATLVLGPNGRRVIQPRPKRRDPAAEATRYFAEIDNLYVPGPGVVNGRMRVGVRPAQGRITTLELEVPEGFTVSDVTRGPVGAWRFDPAERRLHVAIEPAQTRAFRFDVETQLSTGALPVDLTLEPLRIVGAAGEVGMLALAFGGDAQPEGIQPDGLSAVNTGDFDAGLVPLGRDGQPLAVVQRVFRYGSDGGRLALKVASVAPEVRVAGRHVFSLGDDRLVLAADLNVAITRVGLFRLSFALPAGLEVETLSGPALSHWTEVEENGQRIVTLHLNGRTIGEQAFNLSLSGPAPAAQNAWSVPRLVLREATRQTGELLVVPEKGIRLRAGDRENASQLDPRAAGGTQPGTLAFRLLQADWSLQVGIEALEPWVTVQALQDVTAREGQTLTRIGLRYRVENAAVKQLRVRLPGLGAELESTVRATGSAVSDFVKVPDETDLWEIRFQRGIAGETDVQIEFQGQASRDQGTETIVTPEFVDARQTVLYVAVRGGGRLELETNGLPRGWQRTDWNAVPAMLQNRSDRSVPALCFRVAEPEDALTVTVHRHAVAQALKLRVTEGALTSIFSPAGPVLTAVDLTVDVVEKSTLRVRLPEGSRLFNTFVNGESVAIVREEGEYLFYVSAIPEGERSASVRMVYALPGPPDGRIQLTGPGLSVPLENVVWRVVIPPGYELEDYRGGLRLRTERSAGLFGLEQYQSLVVSKRSAETEKAVALLEEANALLQRGDQQQAGEYLARATSAGALDEASNEDARVQLRALKTQQAVLGLNTRRQRLYLDNRDDTARNEQLEQAATLNPFMQGKANFNPNEVDQLLMGNTLEENAALRGIAARIVDQQLTVQPAAGAIDVTMPERGRVLVFTRSLQVNGSAPLELQLEVGKSVRANAGLVLGCVLAIAAVVAFARPRAAGAGK